MEAVDVKRLGLVLACMALLAMAGPVLAVGHVGHVDTDTFQEDYVSGDVIPPELFLRVLSEDHLAGIDLDHISVDMPDGTWTLEFLGGVAVRSEDLAGASSLSPQAGWSFTGELAGKFDTRGANMILVRRTTDDMWDGFYGTLAFTIDPDHDQDGQTGYVIAAKAVKQQETPSGGGGGGCSALGFAPAALFLLVPLFLLRRRS
jgi:Synergist-CTERM protein sorting domain-containing protein